jgi:hypothetical protein
LNCVAYNEPAEVVWNARSIDGVHIEYNYKHVRDAIDLSTQDESYWLYPLTARDVLTKISLATDEIFRLAGGGACASRS